MEIDYLKSPRHGTCSPKLATGDPCMESPSARIEHSPTNMETGTPWIESESPSLEHVLTNVGYVTLGMTRGISRIEICFARKLNLALLAGHLVLHMQNLKLEAWNLALFVWKSMSHHEK